MMGISYESSSEVFMKKSRRLAINAMLATLILVFTLIPIPSPIVSTALLPLIPVLVGAQTEGYKTAGFLGFFFGLISLISAFVVPTPLSPAFYNPLVSIFPRICVGLMSCATFKLMERLWKDRGHKLLRQSTCSIIASIMGVVTNTALVLAMIWAFYHGKTFGSTAITPEFMMGLVGINFVIEVVGSAILVPPIVIAVNNFNNANRKTHIGE